eukprot:2949505-Amphidinium_carterae.1
MHSAQKVYDAGLLHRNSAPHVGTECAEVTVELLQPWMPAHVVTKLEVQVQCRGTPSAGLFRALRRTFLASLQKREFRCNFACPCATQGARVSSVLQLLDFISTCTLPHA